MLHKVNWREKGLNVLEAARELGVSELRSVVFIDDNPIEVADVHFRCPEASTLLAPDGGEDEADLYWEHCWALDTFRVTSEDASRATRVKTEQTRRGTRRR